MCKVYTWSGVEDNRTCVQCTLGVEWRIIVHVYSVHLALFERIVFEYLVNSSKFLGSMTC
jgi:hypothetical protein